MSDDRPMVVKVSVALQEFTAELVALHEEGETQTPRYHRLEGGVTALVVVMADLTDQPQQEVMKEHGLRGSFWPPLADEN